MRDIMHLGKVLVTGANRGLGVHIQQTFYSHGHEVLPHNGSSEYDFGEMRNVVALAAKAREEGVSILINNAAITCPGKPLGQYTPQEIQEMISVNLTAPIILTNLLCENLTHIININSMVGLEIKKYRTVYSATKWGLRGFSQSFKNGKNGINVLDYQYSNDSE